MFSVDKLEMYFFNYLIQKEPGVLKPEERGFYEQSSAIYGSLRNRLAAYSLSFSTLVFA